MPLIWLGGCETGPTPFPILDRPDMQVAVTATGQMANQHSHPFSFNEVVLGKVLRGMKVVDRDRMLGFGILGETGGTPAFLDSQIVQLAPALARGFRLSSPWDIVTFYFLTPNNEGETLVSSGGMFVTDKRFLHILLANSRTRPSDTSNSFVTGSELDHRQHPLIPIGRFQFRLSFDLPDALVVDDGTSGWPSLVDQEQTIILDLFKLIPELRESQS